MFELKTFYCPGCGSEIHEKLSDGDEYVCGSCKKLFHVLIDEHSHNVGFVSVEGGASVQPLGLPRGSIRAVATVLLSVCCWILIWLNRSVPGYLLGLLLTVIGYYFAFRKKDGQEDRFYDASTAPQQPLSLPSGSIRNFLMAGFLIAIIGLLFHGRLLEPAYIEFLLILTGLIAGHLVCKVLPHVNHTPTLNGLNHLKGFTVLTAVLALTLILLTGHYEKLWHIAIALSCVISFYFGSRS